MKVGTSFVKALICICLTTCIRSAHADKYSFYGSDVVTHVLRKLKNIQQEYQNLRDKKNLQHFWNTSPKIDKLSLEFSHGCITATEDINRQTDAQFPFLESAMKDRVKAFIAVLMSKDFLYMLLGKNAFEKFTNGPDDANRNKLKKFLKVSENSQLLESAFLRLNILNDANGILAVSWWFKHAVVTMESGETHNALLSFHPVFTYDISHDTVQFAGLKYTPVIDTEYVKDTDFPIYSASGTQPSVQKDNSMFIE